jgi:hypothetical protein
MSTPMAGAERGNPDNLEELAERLLDAAAVGAFDQALSEAQAHFDSRLESLDPVEQFRYRVLFFDLAQVSTTDSLRQLDTAVGLVSGAIEAGDPAWDAILGSSRLGDIERLAMHGDAAVDLLELLAYSPDPGMRGFAVSQIESLGMRALDAEGDSRVYERLLHAIGASPNAYRIEGLRKQQTSSLPADANPVVETASDLDVRVLAIAGGHAQLRGTAGRLLERRGIATVGIPSSREAVKRERDIIQLLQGADLALVLVRQITHSTSDQVRKAAEKLGIPVVFSTALSAVAIERQLFERDV